MAMSMHHRFGIVVIAIAIGVTFSSSTLADPVGMAPARPALMPRAAGVEDIAVSLLEDARQRLKGGDREAAAALAHDAFELLTASERNGYHPKALSSDKLDLTSRH